MKKIREVLDMKKIKKLFNMVCIDGLSGMALGIFPTLIIGLIISQVGNLIGGRTGEFLVIMGKFASCLTRSGYCCRCSC